MVILLYGQWFLRYRLIFPIAILGMKLAQFGKVPEVAHIISTPWGLKLSLFSLYSQLFPRYSANVKIAIFGHTTWSLVKVTEVYTCNRFLPQGGHDFYPKGVEIELAVALQGKVIKIEQCFS